LILLLSVLVVGLAVPILFREGAPPERAPTFDATRLISDAMRGESATYRDGTGNTITWTVEAAIPPGLDREPRIRLLAVYRDRDGKTAPGGVAHYEHNPVRHGLFPLMAPQDPHGYDRLWVWSRIRREGINFQGERRTVWRFDLIDPALLPEGGNDHVVAWLDEDIPVFGLVRFQRRGTTWELDEWGPHQ